MNSSLLLCLLFWLPAISSIVLTLPLWYWRRIHNLTIKALGIAILLIMQIACAIYYTQQLDEGINWIFLLICMLALTVNVPIFRQYCRIIYYCRCPNCHRLKVFIQKNSQHKWMYCRNCHINYKVDE